jgi:hypothetical protein
LARTGRAAPRRARAVHEREEPADVEKEAAKDVVIAADGVNGEATPEFDEEAWPWGTRFPDAMRVQHDAVNQEAKKPEQEERA